jgi:regulator of protease activity HflC (stomatin/prohibitin superfamily)
METISQVILGLGSLYILVRFMQSIRLVPTRKAYVVERLGNYSKSLNPGFHALIPFIDKVSYKLDLREETIEVEPQECFTRDNVKVEVDGVIYMSVVDEVNASYGITDYRFAAVQLAQTTTRSIIGGMDLDETFEERAKISTGVVKVLSELESIWGIRVHRYEVKNIVPPQTVQQSMEMQMTAERERRAVLARSEGLMESKINEAEGRKNEMINLSEAEKQRRINIAEGKASEILTLAEATAESIEKIAMAVKHPGGDKAVQLQLVDRYLRNIKKAAKKENQVILPLDLTDVARMMGNIDPQKVQKRAD